MKNFAKLAYFAIVLLSMMANKALAQASQIVVGQANVPATTVTGPTDPSPFTFIPFDAPFPPGTTPNVFTLTPEFGVGADDDPCTLRIVPASAPNLPNQGFDVSCLEAQGEDRDTPAFSFDYIAVADGGVSVPLADGSGNVDFVSECADVTDQVFGPTCDNCGTGPQGFAPITFPSAFTGTPALLTQIRSTNNILQGAGVPPGEPEFVEAAVQSGSLNSAGFDVAVDRLEAGNGGNLANAETICYLAVETDGCQELDFSTLNGPPSVFFQAVQASNIDGHDNGATSGEGASFAGGCFASTPVAIASQTARNGNNGGILRVDDVTAGEIILTVDEDRVSNGERGHIDETASVLAFSEIFTTPVTLSFVRFDQFGRRLNVDWQTSSESFHLGFHVWGETNEGWVQLNNRLIPAAGGDTNQTREYQRRIRLSREEESTVSRYGLSTIDNSGYEEFYGPFDSGVDYGEVDTSEAIDWQATRAEFEQSMRDAGYSLFNGRWRQLSESTRNRVETRQLGLNRRVLNLSFEHQGIHRVSASEVLAQVPQWNGRRLQQIALTLNGDAVARHIVSEDDRFDAQDDIIFYVRAPFGQDSIYLSSYQYQLRLDSRRAVDASLFDGRLDSGEDLSRQGLFSVDITTDRLYAASLANDNPWYDTRLLTVGENSASVSFPINFEREPNLQAPAYLEMQLAGGFDIPDDVPDHHIQVAVNGVLVEDARFDGLTLHENTVEIPAGTLQQEGNVVTVTVVGDTGLFADLILIDTLRVSASSSLAGEGEKVFAAQSGVNYAVQSSSESLVFAFTSEGALSVIEASVVSNGESDEIQFAGLPYPDREGLPSINYAVIAESQLPQPLSLELVRAEALHDQQADYWVVAHPQFIGEPLNEFVQLKQQQGHTVSVVNWLDIVEGYGFGNPTPVALDRFLTQANQVAPIKNVLIVGGHTYDYLGVLNEDVVNFIPTHYTAVNVFNFSPSDNQFADLDGDNLPEFALGRWPVRSANDLDLIVAKTSLWHQNRSNKQYQDALLIAQSQDNRGLNFEHQLDANVLPYIQDDQAVNNISQVYMQDFSDQDSPVGAAQAQIAEAINAGAEFVSFAGHGSDAAWSFDSVVDTQFVQQLANSESPALVMPLACYTTNYEAISVNTLAHQWLFAGSQGAAAIHGAAVLGEYRDNAVFARRYLRQVPDSSSVGAAILSAKRQMSGANPMLNNWTLLGDPALPLR